MPNEESLADRLNRLAEQKKVEQDAEKQVQKTQAEINEFIFVNARAEFDQLLHILEEKIAGVNPALKDLLRYELVKGGVAPHVRQGNSAAFLSFIQTISNAPTLIFLRLSFGRPPGMYLDFFSEPPEPERYQLQPAMERNPDRIVWIGDLGEIPSEQLSEFVLSHLTEYFLEHRPVP